MIHSVRWVAGLPPGSLAGESASPLRLDKPSSGVSNTLLEKSGKSIGCWSVRPTSFRCVKFELKIDDDNKLALREAIQNCVAYLFQECRDVPRSIDWFSDGRIDGRYSSRRMKHGTKGKGGKCSFRQLSQPPLAPAPVLHC